MANVPVPTAQIIAVPGTVPFVGPEELARRVGRDALIRLGANESSYGPSPAALAAMHAAVPQSSYYGDPEALELRQALAAKHSCGVEHLSIGAGIDDLLGLLVRAYCAPGDLALMSRGSYPTFVYHVNGFGAKLATTEPDADGRADLDALIEQAHALRPKIVYLANPDNPSGAFHGRAAIERFQAALPPDVLFMLDEAYADFIAPDDLLGPQILPATVRLRTFSKAFGMAGARIGYAIAAPEVIAVFQKIRHHFGVNRVAQSGALAALDDHAYVREVVADIARGREEYHALGERLAARTLPSATNFVCFEIGTRSQAEAMVDALLERGIFVRKPGQPPIDGFIRVTVGTPEQRIAFASAFAEALPLVRARA